MGKMSQRTQRSLYKPGALDLFEARPSRAQEQQLKIIEAAIESFAVNGIDKTSYSSLAKSCGISRPLMHHYFPTTESLFLLAAKYVRSTMLRLAVEGLQDGGTDPVRQLEGYINGCFKWAKLFPQQCRFWLLFYYQCGIGGVAKAENSEFAELGHRRIQTFLEQGKKQGVWAYKDAAQSAKAIQLVITGGLVSCYTEDGYLDFERARETSLHLVKTFLAP